MHKCSNSCLWCSCWWNLDFSFRSYGKESLYKYCMNVDDGCIMRSWRSCLLMVEITTAKPYVFMIRVNRQIKYPKNWGPGSSPSPTRICFENYTYLRNHFANFNQKFLGWSSSKVMFDMSGIQSIMHDLFIL